MLLRGLMRLATKLRRLELKYIMQSFGMPILFGASCEQT